MWSVPRREATLQGRGRTCRGIGVMWLVEPGGCRAVSAEVLEGSHRLGEPLMLLARYFRNITFAAGTFALVEDK